MVKAGPSESFTPPANSPENVDDYYALARQREVEKTRQDVAAQREHVRQEFMNLIPHYEFASDPERAQLVKLNNLLVHRFEGPGMMYWTVFSQKPQELFEYRDILQDEFSEVELQALVDLLEAKKLENSFEVEDNDFTEDDFEV